MTLAAACACDVIGAWAGRYQAKQASASCRTLWTSHARRRLLLSRCPSPRPSLGMHLALGRAPSRAAAAAGKQPVIALLPGPVRYLGLGCAVRKRMRNFPNSCQAVGQQTKQLWHTYVLGRPRSAPPGPRCALSARDQGDEPLPGPPAVCAKPLAGLREGALPVHEGLTLLRCIGELHSSCSRQGPGRASCVWSFFLLIPCGGTLTHPDILGAQYAK